MLAQVLEHRRKAPVEADHEPIVAGGFYGGEDGVQFLISKRKGLFNEDGLARFEGLAGERGVRTMPGHHKNGVDRFILEHGLSTGAGVRERKLALCVHRRQRSTGRHLGQLDIGSIGDVREQHRRGVVAGA